MKRSDNSYRRSHKSSEAVENYSRIYSDEDKGGVRDRFSLARWSLEKHDLDHYLSSRFEDLSKLKVLDFACGTGRLTRFLEDRAQSVTGVDISEEMLAEAAPRLKHAKLVCADITQEDVFGERKFDVISAFRFFLRAEGSLRTEALAKIHQLLKEDGLFFFNVHDSRKSANFPLFLYSDIAGKESPYPGPFDLGVRPCFPDDMVRQQLERSGFKIEKVSHIGLVPNWLYGLPWFTNLYTKIDSLFYRKQALSAFAIERIYYCRKKL